MATGWYIGVDGKARKVKAAYVGVDGKARKVKAGYVGVDGKARKFYTGRLVLEHNNLTSRLHTLHSDTTLPQTNNLPIQFTATISSHPNPLFTSKYIVIKTNYLDEVNYQVYLNGQEGDLFAGLWEVGDVVECSLDTKNYCIYFVY